MVHNEPQTAQILSFAFVMTGLCWSSRRLRRAGQFGLRFDQIGGGCWRSAGAGSGSGRRAKRRWARSLGAWWRPLWWSETQIQPQCDSAIHITHEKKSDMWQNMQTFWLIWACMCTVCTDTCVVQYIATFIQVSPDVIMHKCLYNHVYTIQHGDIVNKHMHHLKWAISNTSGAFLRTLFLW